MGRSSQNGPYDVPFELRLSRKIEGFPNELTVSYSFTANGGDNLYLPTTYDPNTRTRPATGTPDFSLPGIDLPQPEPVGRPGPSLRWPFGQPRPTGDPTTGPGGYPYPDPNPGPNPTPGPTENPDPAPYPTPDPNPNPNPTPDPDPETCDPCAKLDQVLTLLQPQVAGQIDLSPCPTGREDPPEKILAVPEGAAGLSGLSAKIDLALSGLGDLWSLLRCPAPPVVAPTPDAWDIKKELNCPQLVITLKIPGDKSSYRRSFAIPHPKESVRTEAGARAVFTHRKVFTKGSHLTQLVLRDNSKIRLYVSDRNEGQELMDWIVGRCLDVSYQDTPPGKYRHGENASREIIQTPVEFYTVTYYSQGRESDIPDWIFTIPE